MRVARRYLVSGRVQGVGFRYFAEAAARREGLHGWVRNLPDGRVEVAGRRRGRGGRAVRARACGTARPARASTRGRRRHVPSGRDTGFQRSDDQHGPSQSEDSPRARLSEGRAFCSTTSRRCCRIRPGFAPRSTACAIPFKDRASTRRRHREPRVHLRRGRGRPDRRRLCRRSASRASCRRRRVQRDLRSRVRHRHARDPRGRGRKGQRVLIVDDLLATGGTARATRRSRDAASAAGPRAGVSDRAGRR